jgi:hypothetical protein
MPHLTTREGSQEEPVDIPRIVYEENFEEQIRDPFICLIVFLANECLQQVVLGRRAVPQSTL